MQLANLTIFSVLIFILLLNFILFLFYSFFKRREILKIKYRLLFNQNNSFYFKYIFLILSFIILLFSIFNIKYGESKIIKTNNLDIVFILDVSKSMNVKDFKITSKNTNIKYITRLNTAKNLIKTHILNNKNNNYGLIIFAGEAISVMPLTNDYDIFLDFLENVNYENLNIQGTNIYNAFKLGLNRFNISDKNKPKAIILISDGGDSFNKDNLNNIKNLFNNKEKYINLIVGIGTKSGGRILKNNSDGAIENILNKKNLQRLTDSLINLGDNIYEEYNGNIVISKINSKYLKSISNAINGTYFEIKDIKDFNKINNILNNLESKVINNLQEKTKRNANRILTFLSLLFFITYLFLSSVKNILNTKV